MNRYQKIEIKDLSGGGQQEYFQNSLNSFYVSEKMQFDLEAKKIKLAPKMESQTVAAGVSTGEQVICEHNGYNFFLVSDSAASAVKLYHRSNLGAFSLKYTFATCSEVYSLFSFNGNLFAYYYDDTAVAAKYAYSADNGTTFTVYAVAHAWSEPIKGPDGKYFVFGSGQIAETEDWLTFTNIRTLTIPANISITQLYKKYPVQFLNGFFYIVGEKKVGTGGLVYAKKYVVLKIHDDLTAEIIKEFVGCRYVDFIDSGESLFFLVQRRQKADLYFFDSENFEKIKGFSRNLPIYNAKIRFCDGDSIYLAICPTDATNNSHIYLLKSKYFLIKLFEIGAAYDNFSTFKFFESINFACYDATVGSEDDIVYNESLASFEATGFIETSIYSDGEIAPKQLILRHKPLAANTSVKIYKKFDHAAAFSLILTSDTDNAIKSKYTFPNGTIIDFFQFKIELITTDPSLTPEDVQLEFLYLPLGLEKSK